MATRIIVKNLPLHLTQDAFTKHFSDYSSPTDSRLQTSKFGKSRRFGFVGFQSVVEAENAVQHWNNTYVGSTKINAELARTVEEESTTNYKRKRPIEDALATAQLAKGSKRGKREDPEGESDPKFREFLRLNEKRSKSRTFLNDDEEFVQQAAVEDEAEIGSAPEDVEYERLPAQRTETYEVIEHEAEPAEVIEQVRTVPDVPDDADDAEWLRNRTSRTLDLTDGTEAQVPQAVIFKSTSQNTPNHTDPLSEPVLKRQTKQQIVQPKSEEEIQAERAAADAAVKADAIATIKDTARLFLRNLAFTVDEPALQELFVNYGNVQEVHIPQSVTGAPKGTAYIHFDKASDAIAAYDDLDGKSYHGRLLHILPGQAKITVEKPTAPGAKSNIGEKRKEERRKEAAKSRFNWNSLFLNQNAVMENTAKKFGISKSELLDPTQSSSAVTMALAESSALNTIKKFFISHGVNLQSFSQTKQKDDSILLFKNLPSHVNEEELTKLVEGAGGVIRRIIIPDIGGLAIVEVLDGNQGKSVFGKLAYRKFGDGLIYLEKGPVDTFTSAASTTTTGTKTRADDDDEGKDDRDEEESGGEMEKATVYVKNLNFETRAPELTKVFESLKGFRQATVKTKPNPKDAKGRLSMGFGFIEFSSEPDARAAISTMQGFSLDNHALSLKLSTGKSTDSTTTTSGGGGTKVVVKNIPFESSKSDISRLFSTYGALKSIRVPKKYNSNLRGFAFLEFISKREAKNAIEALSGTHLLGRRLVIEYADTELRGDEGVDQVIEKTRGKKLALERVEGGKRKSGKVNLDGTEADAFQ